MIPRGGDVVIRMLEHVPQVTSTPLLQATIAPGPGVDTAADDLDHRLGPGGYAPARVGHGRGEEARDDDGDGVHEVHVHTREGFWSRLRSGLRPHRGIAPDN